MVEKLFPNPFLKNQNWAYFWVNSLNFAQFIYIVSQVEGYRIILKLSFRPLAFTSYKAFLKNKKRSGDVWRGLLDVINDNENEVENEKQIS